MRIVCVSDTHLQHRGVLRQLPYGDVLIHAGDGTLNGSRRELEVFSDWLKAQPHPFKIFVPGNHDLGFEDDLPAASALMGAGVRVLIDEGVTHQGVKFYGTPYQPEFMGWGFNLPRGPALRRKWALIPDDTQVLITHTPPLGVLDLVPAGEHVGCADMAQALTRLEKLRLHVFGHIHHSYGVAKPGRTMFFNASTCDERYVPVNPPLVYDLEEG